MTALLPPPPYRRRPPTLHFVAIAALLAGALVLQVMGRRGPLPLHPVPSLAQALGDEVLIADTEYRMALFAHDLARWLGVPGVTSPTTWEERAVAHYEVLALGPRPAAPACRRLGIIYGRRGYLRQAREMLERAAVLDSSTADVCLALALVYSDEPIPAGQSRKVIELLRRQPKYWQLVSLADLARRMKQPQEEATLAAAAGADLRRFGFAFAGLQLLVLLIAAGSFVAAAVLVVRMLFRRDQPAVFWPSRLPFAGWIDVVEVLGLVAFANALGQVLRQQLAASLPTGSSADQALRLAHYLLCAVPAAVLVMRKAGTGGARWWLALGLTSERAPRHLLNGLMALGLTLVAVPLVVSLANSTTWLRAAGVVAGRASPSGLPVDLLIAVLLAPLAEEIVFRGFVLGSLADRLRPLPAALLSALAFAGVHLTWSVPAFLALVTLGFVSAYAYRATRSLVPSLVLHAGYNALIVAGIYILRM